LVQPVYYTNMQDHCKHRYYCAFINEILAR